MKRKILIIGSSGNFGKYLFQKLKKNNSVIGVQNKPDKKKYICEDLSISKLNIDTFKLIKKKHAKLDAIIICTGKSQRSQAKEIEENFIESFKSNFLTVANSINSYLKVYKNKSTKIIVISSIAAIKIIDAPIEYSTSKAALNHYCKIKAKELSKDNIKINLISPGNILNKNNNWYKKIKFDKSKVQKYIKDNVPLNSFCKPSQLLALCNLLIDDSGDFFQGSNLIVDGGQIL